MEHILTLFGKSILIPDRNREPLYDSSKQFENQFYSFKCKCETTINLNLPSYIGNYSDRDKVLGEENSELIRLHFNLRSDNSLINGWPKFRVEIYTICRKKYLVYIAVFEPANGWYKIIPQGISEILEI